MTPTEALRRDIIAILVGAALSWVAHNEWHQHQENAALDVCLVEAQKVADGLSECVALMKRAQETEGECTVPRSATSPPWSTD